MYPLEILRGSDYVALACQKAEGSSQVVRIGLDATGRPKTNPADVEIHAMGRRHGDVLADQQGERLLVRSQISGSSWWVWDGRRKAWAGVVGITVHDNGLHAATGLDPTTGRLYALVPDYWDRSVGTFRFLEGGLGYSDTRLTPAPQLRIPVPELAYPGLRRIEVDPAGRGRPRRLFVMRGDFGLTCASPSSTEVLVPCGTEDHWLVIEDSEAVIDRPPVNDVDRFTIDVDERTGVTAANFERSAAGFGARVMLVSGVSGATTRQFDTDPVVHGSACPPADREVVLGLVASARTGNVAASAEAAAVRSDPTTAEDLADPARRCWPNPRMGATKLGEIPPPDADVPDLLQSASASCSGDQRKQAQPRSGPPAQEAEAGCGRATGSFEARAVARGTSLGAVTVGEATSRAWVEDDPQRGRITRVESVARNVVLGDLGTIGLVRATATAWAGGRPGTAGTSFTREICGVAVGIMQERECLDDKQKADLARHVVSSSGGQVEVRLRSPDADLAPGSPGGYQAAVQRGAGEVFVDTIVNRDHSKVVPGLELVAYRDDQFGPAREIVQLAGVQAASQYGIYCLFGPAPSGKACNTSALGPVDGDGEPMSGAEAFSSGYLGDAVDSGSSSFESAASVASSEEAGGSNPVARLLRRLAQVPADVLRLIASGPAELLLTAGMWLLLWLPCCVFERRRAARRALPLRF